MSNSNLSTNDEVTEFSLSSVKSKKADGQARDTNGRWVGSGANVRWRSNNKDWAGVVKSIKGGKAIVEVKHADGTVSMTTLEVNTLRVATSKATITKQPPTQVEDSHSIGTHTTDQEVVQKLSEDGGAIIKAADGYSLEIKKDKKNGERLLYQIFDPNGRSLGISSDASVLDAIRADDDTKGAEPDLFANVPATVPSPVAPVVASTVKRVARDGSGAVLQVADEFQLISLEYGHVIEVSSDMKTLTASGAWRKPVSGEDSDILKKFEVASQPLEGIEVLSQTQDTPYRVPQAVKDEISTALSNRSDWAEEDVIIATALVEDEAVSLDKVQWIADFFAETKPDAMLHGGFKGEKWAEKIVAEPVLDTFEADKYLLDPSLHYFGIGDNEYSAVIHDVIAVDFVNSHVYFWGETGFELSETTVVDSIEAPMVLPLDAETAKATVIWKDSQATDSLDVRDLDWEERNLFDTADSEIDYEELDDYTMVAAAEYTPQERSINAKRQRRAPGGKFGEGAVKPRGKLLTSYAKARLPKNMPIVANPWKSIAEWVQGMRDEKIAKDPTKNLDGSKPVLVAAGAPVAEEAPAETPAETEQTTPQTDAIYFAIVDNVDKTAVLDVIAITRENKTPAAWKRSESEWVEHNEILVSLQGAAPPPLVKLESPDPAENIISQVDSYDSEGAVTASALSEIDAKRGYSLPDGTFTINTESDLEYSVRAFGNVSEDRRSEVKQHIRKRARALNRMGVLPAEWRQTTPADAGEKLARTSVLYGDFGEVITAAGVPGIADTPSDWAAVKKLQNYWTRGRGAAKIRWGTPGDLTRAHKHLAKYVGPQRAWGLAQKYHKSVFGVYNHTHDVATGQYRGR